MKNIKKFESFSQSEIDRILDKISATGMDSLTPGEKQYLADPENTDVSVARAKPQPSQQSGGFYVSGPHYLPDTPNQPSYNTPNRSLRQQKINSKVNGKRAILLKRIPDSISDRTNLLKIFYPSLEFTPQGNFRLKVNEGSDIVFYYYSTESLSVTFVYNRNEISDFDVCLVEDDLSVYEKTLSNLISVGKHILGLDDYYYFAYAPFKKEVSFSSSDGGWVKLKPGKFDDFMKVIKGKDSWFILDEIHDNYNKYKDLCYDPHGEGDMDDIEEDFLSCGLVDKTEIEGEFCEQLDEPPLHRDPYPVEKIKDRNLEYSIIPIGEYFINLGRNICL